MIKFYQLIMTMCYWGGYTDHKRGTLRLNRLYWWAWNKKFDEIDYKYGPSQLAEYHARNNGYWNLFYAHFLATSVVSKDKNNKYIKLQDIMPIGLIYKICQVRPYGGKS